MTDLGLARWYIKRAYHNYSQARRLFRRNNVESIIASFEAIEFSLKGICELLDVKNIGHEHFLKATTISALASKIEEKGFGDRKILIQMTPLILSYTDELRIVARYGISHEQFPRATPNEIFSRQYATEVLKDAETLCNLLSKIEIKERWLPTVKVGVLNGYVTGENELQCNKMPFANPNPAFWKERIQRIAPSFDVQFEIEEIKAEDISEKYAIILNPFGEAYPEIDIKEKPIFSMLKDYIEMGGVYANTGGFPFFYAWNVVATKDNLQPLCDKILMMPKEVKIEGTNISIKNFQEYLEFTGSLLFKEFAAIPTPVSKKRKVRQEKADVTNFGDLLPGVGEVKEFRAIPKSIECLPIVRAEDEISAEIYPICALKRGQGYLLLAGMNTKEVTEADLFSRAVVGFSRWRKQQLQPRT
jgi:HEPN domain-containing protein